MKMFRNVRDLLIAVRDSNQKRWGLFGKWTHSFNFSKNTLLIELALDDKLIQYDGGWCLRLTKKGKRFLDSTFTCVTQHEKCREWTAVIDKDFYVGDCLNVFQNKYIIKSIGSDRSIELNESS